MKLVLEVSWGCLRQYYIPIQEDILERRVIDGNLDFVKENNVILVVYLAHT